MANPCIVIFKGTEYSHDEFMGMLHDGLLDNLVENKVIEMPVTTAAKAKAAKAAPVKAEKSVIGQDTDLKGEKKQYAYFFDKDGFVNRIGVAIENGKMYLDINTKQDNQGRYTVNLRQKSNDAIVGTAYVIPEVKGEKLSKAQIKERAIPVVSESIHLDSVEKAIEKVNGEKQSDFEKTIAEGRMSAKDASDIIKSAGIEVPKEISDLIKPEPAKVGKEPSKMATKLLTHLGIEPTGPAQFQLDKGEAAMPKPPEKPTGLDKEGRKLSKEEKVKEKEKYNKELKKYEADKLSYEQDLEAKRQANEEVKGIFDRAEIEENNLNDEPIKIAPVEEKDIPKQKITIDPNDKRPEAVVMSKMVIKMKDWLTGSSRVGLGMSDTLRTGERDVVELDKNGKQVTKTIRDEGGIGFPFKSLLDVINGVIAKGKKAMAWAAVGEGAGSSMANAAAKSKQISGRELKQHYFDSLDLTPEQKQRLEDAIPDDKQYGLVTIYKMGADGIKSNEAFSKEAFRLMDVKLSPEEKQQAFSLIEKRLDKISWGDKAIEGEKRTIKEKYINQLKDAKTFEELEAILNGDASDMSLGTKAEIIQNVILSTEKTESNEKVNPLATLLKEKGITIESISNTLAEPIMDGIDQGQPMILLAVDHEAGVIKDKDRHANYSYGVPGFPIGIFNETSQMHHISPEMMDMFVKTATTTVDENVKVKGSDEKVRISISHDNSGNYSAQLGKGDEKIQFTNKKGIFLNPDGTFCNEKGKTISETAKPLLLKSKEEINKELKKQGYTVSEASKKEYTQKISGSNVANLMQKAKAGIITIFKDPQITAQQKLVKYLQVAFPGIEVELDAKKYENIEADFRNKKLLNSKQQTFGVVNGKDGKVYLNPKLLNNNTQVHEMGHIWNMTIKKSNPNVHAKGIELITNSNYIDNVINNPKYKKLIVNAFGKDAIKIDEETGRNKINESHLQFQEIQEYVADEALAKAIGDKGELFINEAQKRAWEKFLESLYAAIKKLTGLTKLTDDQIADLKLEDFLNGALKDILGGEKVSDITSEQIVEMNKSGKLPKFALEGSAEQPIESKIKDFIEQERAAGETDASIRKGIEEIADQIGIDKTKIDELFQKEAKPKEGAVTGIKNAVVEAEREQRGLPQIDKDFLRKTDKTVFNNAQNMIDSGEFNPREQAKYFAENPTEASAEQQMAFEIDRVKIKNELDSLNKDLVEANEKGNKQEAFVIAEKISNLEDAMDLNDRAVTYAGTKIGQALAIRRRLMGLDFSMQKMKSDYYRDNPAATTIPTEIKQKLESFEKEVSDLKGRLEESEKQRKLAEEKQAIESIQGSIEREQNAPPKPAKKISDATKKIADNLRKGKLHSKPSIFSAATPGSLIFDLAIEAASKTIEKSGDIAQALVDGVEIALKTVRDSDWYKGLDKNKQKEAEKGIVDYINDVHSEETGVEKDEKGLSGLQKRVREIVSEGETDINNIVKKIQEEMFPDKSDREIRDAITKYGEQKDVTQDDLTKAVNRAKREGVLISKIEDAEQGKRPLRKLLGRDTPTDREREKTRYLNELLKSLPEEETDTYNKIKTATESKVKRLENRVADLKKRIQDLRNGITPEKTVRKPIPDTEDIIKLEKERDELLKEIDGLEVKQQLTDAEYLAKWKDRAKKNITKYEQKIANKDFSTKKQRQPIHTRESAEILAELNAAKKKYKAFREAEHQKTKSSTIKFLETVAKVPRAVILTSTHIFGKLGSFDLGEMVTHPISEAVQALASYIPGIRQIIKGAPMQGGGKFNTKAIVKSYSEFFNPIKLWKDWKSIYKIGLTEQMEKHGSHLPEVVTDYWSKINNAMEISGKSHMMLKAPLLRAKTEMYFTKLQDSYTKNFEKSVEEGIANGEDPSDPQVILAMQGKAFAMAYNDIMLGKNILSAAWNAFVAGIGAPKTEVSGTKAAGKVIEATTRAKIPIVGVPLNFANAVIDYSGLGLGKAIWNMSFAQAKAAKVTGNTFLGEILASGFKNMSEADKEVITKNIKRGSIGAALFIYGYLNKDEIGGAPLPGEKRKAGEIQPFEQVYFGHKLPKWVHLPQLAAIEVGATFGHAMDYYKNQKEKSAVSEATTATIKNLAKSVPFTEEPIRFKKSLNSSEGLSNYLAEFAKSSTIPRDIQEQVLPINQKPKGFVETYTSRKVFKSSDEYEKAQLEQEFKDFKEEQKKKRTKGAKEEKEAPKPSNASIAAKAVKFGLKVPTGFFNKK